MRFEQISSKGLEKGRFSEGTLNRKTLFSKFSTNWKTCYVSFSSRSGNKERVFTKVSFTKKRLLVGFPRTGLGVIIHGSSVILPIRHVHY